MKNITIVVSKFRLAMVAILVIGLVLLNLYLPKNERSDRMIVEYNNDGKCELLLWNDDKLIARLYSSDKEDCKLYLIKNSSH